MKRKHLVALGLALISVLTLTCFVACTEVDDEHTHSWATEWSSDETEHWHACTSGDCTEKNDVAAHISDNVIHYNADKTKEYNECSVCGAKMNETDHTHTATGEYLSDETNHWKLCACGEKVNVTAHVAGTEVKHAADKNYHWNECECGLEMNKTEHTAADDNYSSDAENHWKLCACGEKTDVAAHVSDNLIHYNTDKTKEYNECSVCGAKMNEIDHTHTATGEYLNDGEKHWKLCACGEKTDVAAHVSDNVIHYNTDKTKEYNECSVCGEKMNEIDHTHTATGEYLSDETNHWKLCACGEKTNIVAHVSDNVIHYNADKTKEYNECSVCGAKMNEVDHTHTAKDDTYQHDGEAHWKLCACGEKVETDAHESDETTHYDVANMKEYNLCSVCGERMNETAHIHNYATTANTDGNYACACGVAVNPFKGLAKSNIAFYDSEKVALAEDTVFGGKKYVGQADSDSSIGGGWDKYINSNDYYYDSYYFTLKFAETVRFVECGDVQLLAGVQYLVKMTKRTTEETANGGWHLLVKEMAAPDSEYKEITMGSYRLGDHNTDTYLGKAYFILFLHFVTINGETNYNVEMSTLYVKNTDFSSEFAGMTKVSDSALATDALTAEETIGELSVFYKENLTSSVGNNIGSGYTMDYSGQYSEYRFAFKATEDLLIVVANGNYKIVPYVWYVMKVEKIPDQGEGAVKWKIYFKQVGADDSTFKEIAADAWKVGANTTVGDNTSASNLLCDMYIWRNDALQQIPFDFYATAIWAK